ncbi:hypothetical protein AXG93_4893s1050 [Marchantia polymorpha subsp. ruderalis]|uniref:Uncharacterized protein n=1 Tax=Marchantia polymorpha subsp. ruderalis TaxID=1480154 RepID=A0A176WIC0_MARPO|nr:hypothetical protein AXG93_4893s1050 [Marchantia polymorpha subsp. ruderalis]
MATGRESGEENHSGGQRARDLPGFRLAELQHGSDSGPTSELACQKVVVPVGHALLGSAASPELLRSPYQAGAGISRHVTWVPRSGGFVSPLGATGVQLFAGGGAHGPTVYSTPLEFYMLSVPPLGISPASSQQHTIAVAENDENQSKRTDLRQKSAPTHCVRPEGPPLPPVLPVQPGKERKSPATH